MFLTGCTSPLFRAQSPDAGEFDQLVEETSTTKLVGDLASAWGDRWLKVEGVALVTQLDGTGSDPPPSPLTDQLIKSMQTHEVRPAREALASKDTAMVMVGGFIPPGAQKGDTFDLRISVPPRSRTESLSSGWLMPTRLRQVMVIDRHLHSSDVAALGQGEVLVESLFDKSGGDVSEVRGRVLGGGVVRQPREFGLGIHSEHSSVRTSSMIGNAVNERFHHFDRGKKSGVATPLRDNQVKLALHPRYKHNFTRYLRVIRNIAVGETPGDRTNRLIMLDRMLHEPTTAELAALRLEAIGDGAKPILVKALSSHDAEVRFYAAEALAYLDVPEASEALFQAAQNEFNFRWRALTALAAMEQVGAQDALVRLLDAPGAETRYGAFRALRVSDPYDSLVHGQIMGKSFGFHTVPSAEEPMIHFSRSRRPEIVLFGQGQRIDPPAFLYAGHEILIKGVGRDKLKISLFKPNEETEHVFCSTSVDELIRAIVDFGGGYQEVLAALTSAHKKGYLDVRLEIGASPSARRTYKKRDSIAESTAPESRYQVVNSIPDLFSDRLATERSEESADAWDANQDLAPAERTEGGWFAKMGRWFSE
jgi:flagellar basal body P-ring protein FlgI